ncbi:MAG TPA: heavy-metal-associated domain-containing protein [Candidatus Kapabacteria bacterium]|nr:heavy-metal-associated domain-containing protein [Candidatus Kapabacteria bacterium]
MKLSVIAFASLLLLASCAKEEVKEESIKQPADPNITLASISVPHTQCEMCEETITKAATAVPGVTAVKANAGTDSTQVSFDKTKTDLASIEKAIAMAGYTANATYRDSAAYEDLPSCCKEKGHQ